MQFPSPRAHAMAAPAAACPRPLLPGTRLSAAFFLALRGRRRGHGRAVAAVRAREQGAAPPDPAAILRRPEVTTTVPVEEETESDTESSSDGSGEDEAPEEGIQQRSKVPEREWVDWEDLILEDTVPLVGFVRMILHSGKYESGDRLSPEHEKVILERLLPYHPQYEKKIGSGIDYITIGNSASVAGISRRICLLEHPKSQEPAQRAPSRPTINNHTLDTHGHRHSTAAAEP
ncbi:hypothetical protein PR202_ga02859 [Eleusine coracana subsp. coracana]|uniref:Uncharacterized protein n=1 Tax=Eleusine coracana subsp. coracana TaxID=191504 RepID=A0AAV5BKK2_ELECO|nr:hypothetical protein PR202_ga02859 [Eleusine coracana subsp. coracana]